ncbi:integral membrane protein [Cordyceps javanica]|uniref:Integral membrane protein n=1 Tax=Cordyceps javanica TaxID=43265 RepID=A0A545VN18_9HYPO|nr:integral membrane protein [Cordyceps javanica]TQW03119.1 integral membrane protein [Cordyceps javanica]
MMSIKSLLVAVLALAGTGEAKVTYYNSGVIKGWASMDKTHKGTVEEVKDISYKAKTSLKMTQTYDPKYHKEYRSLVVCPSSYQRGDAFWYGFMVRLADDWQFVDQPINILEFFSRRGVNGEQVNCGDFDMTGTTLWIQNDQLHGRHVGGKYMGKDCKQNIIDLPNMAKIEPGKFHKIIFHVKWEDNGWGFSQWFVDGRKVVDKKDIATTVGGKWKFQFRVGASMPAWHDEGEMQGNQTVREIWFDEIAVGTEYKDVDPDQN